MAVTCINETTHNDIPKVDITFSDVLTVNQIRKYHIGKYSPLQVQEVLLFLEDQGQTLSDTEITKTGKKKYYFYFDKDVKESLLNELSSRGYKPIKRVRNKVPTYSKFYSVWQYDREKFRKLLNCWLKTDEGKTRTHNSLLQKQSEILEQCWVLNEDNTRVRDSDAQHIYRYKTLHRILECIANCLMHDYGIDTGDMVKYLLHRTNIVIYQSEEGMKPQAELSNTIMENIKTRVILHLHLLKGLKQGLDIEEAVRLAYQDTCRI